jgi:hypothetical protein
MTYCAGGLVPGDTCQVGIPPRIIHVLEVHEYDPPQQTGWLPRPSLSLLVLRAGEQPNPRSEFQGTSIEPDGGVPLTLELLFRPYAFLKTGDDVVDAAGRAWRFDGPWTWATYDGAGGVPTSPYPADRWRGPSRRRGRDRYRIAQSRGHSLAPGRRPTGQVA